MQTAEQRLEALRKARPRNRWHEFTAWFFAVACVLALVSMDLQWGRIFAPASQPGLARFLEQDAKPWVLRPGNGGWSEFGPWLWRILREYGLRAVAATFAIALAAITLAALWGACLAPFAAHTWARRDPYAGDRPGPVRWYRGLVRTLCLALRALPEYVLGFLLLALLSGSTWPAVLALALHNAGILGRLFGDALEDNPTRPLTALAGTGAPRRALVVFGAAPLAFSRGLAYFFYRFETCVREATVLGMLGVISIGYSVKELQAKQFYDEMLVLVALGGGLVMAADLLSSALRARLRSPQTSQLPVQMPPGSPRMPRP
ncbi:MAG: ABC transporter permease subunit [Planctomycetota bacterium]